MSLSAFAVPVLLDTMHEAHHMAEQWSRLYHYGHIYLPGLCVATSGLYGLAAYNRQQGVRRWASTRYALAAVSTIAMVPFTWAVMSPTNNLLFSLAAADSAVDQGHARDLVIKWAWMHVARSLTPLLGAFLGFSTILQEIRT